MTGGCEAVEKKIPLFNHEAHGAVSLWFVVSFCFELVVDVGFMVASWFLRCFGHLPYHSSSYNIRFKALSIGL